MGSRQWCSLQEQLRGNQHVQAVQWIISKICVETLRESYRGTGSKPYRPELMLAIVLVEILSGRTSPAQWFEDATTRDQCKFVGRGISPSRTAWYEFRNRAAKFIDSIHEQLLRDAIQHELINPEEAALDGTFTAANASRHKIYNLKQINRRLNKIKRAIKQFDNPLQIASTRHLTKVPKWIGKTPSGRRRQLDCLRRAKREMLDMIRVNRSVHARQRRDERKLVISPADPDAVIGRDKHNVLRPLYNTQQLIDCCTGVILTFEVFRQNNDNGTLRPILQRSQNLLGNRIKRVYADSSYCSILDLKDCDSLGIDLRAPVQNNTLQQRKLPNGEIQIPSGDFDFNASTGELRCPGGHAMKLVRTANVPRSCGRTVEELRFEQSEKKCSVCSLAFKCLRANTRRRTVSRQKDQPILDAQQKKMEGEAGLTSRRKRASTVERIFGDGKRHRNQNFQNGRGLTRVRAEVGLLVIAQNALTLYNREKRRNEAGP